MAIEVQDKAAPGVTADRASEERAIGSLINRAARLADDQEFLAWMELFTDDGVYAGITFENRRDNGLYLFRDTGRQMLHMRVAFLMGLWQVPRGKTTHLVSNLEIELLDESSATCVSNFVIARTGELEMTKLHAAGRYYDRLQKVDGAWRFKSREVVVDTNVLPSEFTDLL
jgi:3-phenylpropionate/cinnamic acid dioxygenase small subunit